MKLLEQELVTSRKYGNRSEGTDAAGLVRFSVVVPMYNVEPYLGDLLNSLENQAPGNFEVQYVFIDDGSPDRCAELAHEWMRKGNYYGYVIEKPNGGVSSARNTGLEKVDSEWVIFPDSDDYLSNDFLANAAELLGRDESLSYNILGNNLVRYMESNESTVDNHPLKFKFAGGSRVVDLELSPEFIHMTAASSFFRVETLKKNQIRFDTRLHASEDALFIANILTLDERPFLGINADSTYFYRKRLAGNSALDTFAGKPETYLSRLELGYLEFFRNLERRGQQLPTWLMMTLLYEFRWLFGAEMSVQSKETVLGVEGRKEFLSLVTSLLQFVSSEAIKSYRVTGMSWEIRHVLLSLKGESVDDLPVYISDFDRDQNLIKIRYWFNNDLPNEEFLVGGVPVSFTSAKVRSLDYFGQTALSERILWLRQQGDLLIKLNGEMRQLEFAGPRIQHYEIQNSSLERYFAKTKQESVLGRQKLYMTAKPLKWHLKKAFAEWRAVRTTNRDLSNLTEGELRKASGRRFAQIRRASWSEESRQRYANAWVFSDRLLQAQDNAEHLYRWIMQNEPEINAWYVLKRESPDWNRLSNEGFRLVEFGALEHYKLMLNASFHLSSHADYEMFEPIPHRFYVLGVRTWKYVFLQHGVTKDDISIWLNTKKFDLFVTATDPETASIAGDHTNYVFDGKIVKKLGFPRFDSLLEKSNSTKKDTLLIVPTWRSSLLKPKELLTGNREVKEDFKESAFYVNWDRFLGDSRLIDYAEKHGLTITLLPHPAMASMMSEFELPPNVVVASYSEGDVQQLFARAKIAITDYSSVAFDLAYAGAAISYFQFDREFLFGQGHTMRQGYFSYENDGFGPVAKNVDSLFVDLESIADGVPNEYEARIEKLGWEQDGQSCERVFKAVLALSKPAELEHARA